jgi:hypothetical protein
MEDVPVTSPHDSSVPLAVRLAALKERMGGGEEAESLTSAMATLDDQQGQLLALVAALTEDVQDLAPRLVAELQAAIAPMVAQIASLGDRLDRLEAGLREHVDSAAISTVETLISTRG